jgi:hypothetical protein
MKTEELFKAAGKILIKILNCYSAEERAKSTNPTKRRKAVPKLKNQQLLEEIALNDPEPDIRSLAVSGIEKQLLLERIALTDSYAMVRIAAVKKLRSQEILRQVVMKDYDRNVYIEALSSIEDYRFIYELISNEEDESISEEVVRNLADRRPSYELSKQLLYPLLTTPSCPIDLKRTALEKMTDPRILDELPETDPPIKLAMEIQLGKSSLIHIEEEVMENPGMAEEVISAAYLVRPVPEASLAIIRLCHNYIGMGDDAYIRELIYLLNEYGDRLLATDYLNCGQEALQTAADIWARKNGYKVVHGAGFCRVRWGEYKHQIVMD